MSATSGAPSVEFFIPYVGSADLLRDAVASVLAQSDPQWRLTVVEDGDQHTGVADWINGLGDARVAHVLNKTNLGVSRNFQRCVELASADWITILGCDDLLLPGYLAAVRGTIRNHPESAAVVPAVEVIDGQGHPSSNATDRIKAWLTPGRGATTVLAGEPAFVRLMHGNWTYFPSICWRREAVGRVGFRPDLRVTVDLALLAQLLLQDEHLVRVPTVVFRYRRHSSSVSSSDARAAGRFTEEARLFDELADACDRRGWSRGRRAARWHVASRLHAATLVLPTLVASPSRARRLARHAVAS